MLNAVSGLRQETSNLFKKIDWQIPEISYIQKYRKS